MAVSLFDQVINFLICLLEIVCNKLIVSLLSASYLRIFISLKPIFSLQ